MATYMASPTPLNAPDGGRVSAAPPMPTGLNVSTLVELAYSRGFTLVAAMLMLVFVLWLNVTVLRDLQEGNARIMETQREISRSQSDIARTLEQVSRRLELRS